MRSIVAAISLLIAAVPVRAQAPENYTLTVTPREAGLLGQAIMYLPKMAADPLLAKLQKQIDDQVKAAKKPEPPAKKP